MRIFAPRRHLGLLALFVAGVGCSGGSSAKHAPASATAPVNSAATAPVPSGAIAPGVSATTTAPTTSSSVAPVPSASIALAMSRCVYANVARNGAVSPGDTLTVTFNREVLLNGAQDPNMEFVMPVAGNTFGAGATLAAVTSRATDVVITLGARPNLRVSGAFDVAFVGSGDASGIAVAANGVLTDAKGQRPAIGSVDVDGPFREEWRNVAALVEPRFLHTATLLKDGRILIAGGLRLGHGAWELENMGNPAGTTFAESEVYDPVTNSSTRTSDASLGGAKGDMYDTVQVSGQPRTIFVGRVLHTATLLDDGRVLVLGGVGHDEIDATTGKPIAWDLNSAHLFDPATNQYTVVPHRMKHRRQRHSAQVISNGKVLIAGGMHDVVNGAVNGNAAVEAVFEAEVFDPVQADFAVVTTSVVARLEAATTYDPLKKKVVYVGGATIPGPPWPSPVKFAMAPGAEAFDETAGAFAMTASSPAANLRWQAPVSDAAGRLFTFGGNTKGASIPDSDAIELWDGALFKPIGKLKQARVQARSALIGGYALVAGGVQLGKNDLTSCEVLDTATLTVQPAPSLNFPRVNFTLTTVGAKVYAIGGFFADPAHGSIAAGGVPAPTIEVYSRP